MNIGEIIHKYRKEHGMSMDAFADRCGVSKAYISLLEKNKHPKTGKPIAPSMEKLKNIADAMNMDFDKLFSLLDGEVTVNEKESDINNELMHLAKKGDIEFLIEKYYSPDVLEVVKAYLRCSVAEKEIIRRALGIEDKEE